MVVTGANCSPTLFASHRVTDAIDACAKTAAEDGEVLVCGRVSV